MTVDQDNDVFEVDPFNVDEDDDNYPNVGRWGKWLLHALKVAFVIYSGAHNVQASLIATGGVWWSILSQVIGVLVLEFSIMAIYMAGMGGKITGKIQSALAGLFWLVGVGMAGMGIIADSRLHAGQELGRALTWYINTGLYIAPLVMVLGIVLIVFADPILTQQIANARDRATIARQKVLAQVLAEKATHEARKIAHGVRLEAQKQMANEAKRYYKSNEIQALVRGKAKAHMDTVLAREFGIAPPELPAPTTAGALPAPSNDEPITIVQPRRQFRPTRSRRTGRRNRVPFVTNPAPPTLNDVVDPLIEQFRGLPPDEFQRKVRELFQNLGFQVTIEEASGDNSHSPLP